MPYLLVIFSIVVPVLKFIWDIVKKVIGPAILVTAQKVMLIGITTLILPLVLFKVFLQVKDYIMTKILDYLSTLTIFDDAQLIEITGVAAYIGEKLYIAQVVTILLSAAMVAFMLSILKGR